MRVDRVVRDQFKSLRQILEGLDHNLTARDNFAPEGDSGWVLTSRGPDQTPVYRPVTLSPDATIDWDSISGTPNTLGGYGIENAYTVAQVNNLIDTHTHPAADIVSGILDPSRLGSGASGESTYLRGDSTWQPRTLAGLGIASEVANYAAAGLMQDVECCEPMVIPGPRGIDGTIGRDGTMGPPGIDGEPGEVDFWLVPGPQGPSGAPGAPGASGDTKIFQIIAGEEGSDEWAYLHGPTAGAPGAAGATGIPGPVGPPSWDPEIDEPWIVPGPKGDPGGATAIGGVVGAIAKFAPTTNNLSPSIMTEAGKVITVQGGANSMALALDSSAGFTRDYRFLTAGVARWILRANLTAEGGANAGSNFVINRRDDAGADLGDILTIVRSSGLATFGGDLSALGVAQFGNNAHTNAFIGINGATATNRELLYSTAGSLRWSLRTSATAESGGNLGTDFVINRRSDAGANLGDALTISRASGDALFSSNLTMTGSIFNISNASPVMWWTESDQGADEKIWRMYADAKTFAFQTLNDANSAATTIWAVTRTAGLAFGSFRFHTGIDWIADNTYDVGSGGNYPRFVSAATGFTISGSSVVDFTGAVLRIGNSATWTQLNFMVDATARWHIPTGGNFVPVADNSYDIGTTALQVRDIHIQGELVAENGVNAKSADQAAFSNALTDITGTSWVVGTNEVWAFEMWIPYNRNATAGTVGFAINGPAGSAVQYQVFGTSTALTAYLASVVNGAINTATGAFGAGVSVNSHFVKIHGRFTTGGTAGTAIARGITTAAGATVVCVAGAWVKARRIS